MTSTCPYYQNLCQKKDNSDYAARHYCRGEPSQCKVHSEITANLSRFLSLEGNLDFLERLVEQDGSET